MIKVSGNERCMGWRQRLRLRAVCQGRSLPELSSYGQLKLLPFWDLLRAIRALKNRRFACTKVGGTAQRSEMSKSSRAIAPWLLFRAFELGEKICKLQTHRLKRKLLQCGCCDSATINARDSAFSRSNAIDASSLIAAPRRKFFLECDSFNRAIAATQTVRTEAHRLPPWPVHGYGPVAKRSYGRRQCADNRVRFFYLNHPEFFLWKFSSKAIAAPCIHPG